MIRKKEKVSCQIQSIKNFWEEPESVLYFDIETTGFSAEVSSLYLIGIIYFENGTWITEQWLAENNISEKEILLNFISFIKNKSILICYNGTTFDLPFLLKRSLEYSLTFSLKEKTVLDFYRTFSPYKALFHLENTKQPTLEALIGFHRGKDLNGGALISYYASYLKALIEQKEEADSLLPLFFNHNENDLLGLFHLTALYQFLLSFSFSSNQPKISIKENAMSQKMLYLSKFLPFLPSFSFQSSNFEWKTDQEKHELLLIIPIFSGELKYFYENYKDYYYLPIEKRAIHKQLAQYMDKSFRERARPETCFHSIYGEYLPLPSLLFKSEKEVFRQSYQDKTEYLNLSSLFKDNYSQRIFQGFFEDARKISSKKNKKRGCHKMDLY